MCPRPCRQVIGSSIFLVYDRQRSGAWMIDFAKTSRLPDGQTVDHRAPWVLGNREEGYLTGLDNLCKVRGQPRARPGLRVCTQRPQLGVNLCTQRSQ